MRMNYESDKKLANISISTFNDGIHNALINARFEFYSNVQNVFIKLQIRLPETPNDSKYEKIFFQSNVNVRKVLEGVRGNSLISLVSDIILESMNENLTFPLTKVKRAERNIRNITTNRFNNL